MYARYLLSGVAALALAGSATLSMAANGEPTAEHSRGSMHGALHLSMAKKRTISQELTGRAAVATVGFACEPRPHPSEIIDAEPDTAQAREPVS
jgi:hypothetical protein